MMRDKKRYLLVETDNSIINDEREFSNLIYKEIIKCIGEMNYHKANPKLIKIQGKSRFIIRSSLEGTSQIILAFALIKRVGEKEMAFYTLKSSGTIKALGKFNQ